MSDTTDSSLDLSPDLAELDRVSEWIHAWGSSHGVDEGIIQRLDLCAAEWVTNIINHAFDSPADPYIQLVLKMDSVNILFTFKDNGIYFDPTRAISRELDQQLEDAQIGGWGIRLVRKFCTAMFYSRHQDKNILTLSFSRSVTPSDR